jgi:hypothetical protein
MSIKIFTPTSDDHLGMTAIIHTANLAKGTFMKITGDRTVDACSAEDDIPIGDLFTTTKVADAEGTVQTPFRHWISGLCKGAIAAGDRIKMGNNIGGVQAFKKWIAGTDNPQLIVGACWVGGADTETGEFLVY